MLRFRRLPPHAGPAHCHAHREPEPRARRRAARVPRRRGAAGVRGDGIPVPHPEASQGAGAVPLRRAHRIAGSADGAGLRPWRRDPRARPRVEGGAVALDADRVGRALVRPRHRRQQGPAHRQHGSPAHRARGTRQARIQRQVPDRDGRGNRLGRPARTLHRAPGSPARRPADRLGRSAPVGASGRRCSWARAAASTSTSPSRRAPAATTPATGAA